MTKEMYVTRHQMRTRFGASHQWFDQYMRGRGKIALSKLIQHAPPYFQPRLVDPLFTGTLRRTDGIAAYYKNGYAHREDGPAVIYPDGTKKWLIHGNLHREDGPAIEWADGAVEYYLHGIYLSSEDHWRRVLEGKKRNGGPPP